MGASQPTPARVAQAAPARVKKEAARGKNVAPVKKEAARGKNVAPVKKEAATTVSAVTDAAVPTAQTIAVDVAGLPLARLPEPLKQQAAPATLPHSIRDARELVITPRKNNPSIVKIDLRSGVGNVRVRGVSAPAQVLNLLSVSGTIQLCHKDGQIVPARWMELAKKNGTVVLRVTDGWFSETTCQMAVVRDSYVKPKSFMGGLIWGFRNHCDGCRQKDSLALLVPLSAVLEQHSFGAAPLTFVASGSLAIIVIDLHRGSAHQLAAVLGGAALRQVWEQELDLKMPVWPTSVLSFGHLGRWSVGPLLRVEVSQTLAETSPSAVFVVTPPGLAANAFATSAAIVSRLVDVEGLAIGIVDTARGPKGTFEVQLMRSGQQ